MGFLRDSFCFFVCEISSICGNKIPPLFFVLSEQRLKRASYAVVLPDQGRCHDTCHDRVIMFRSYHCLTEPPCKEKKEKWRGLGGGS